VPVPIPVVKRREIIRKIPVPVKKKGKKKG